MIKKTTITDPVLISVEKQVVYDDQRGNNHQISYKFDLSNDQFPFTKIKVERDDSGDPKSLTLTIMGDWEQYAFEELMKNIK